MSFVHFAGVKLQFCVNVYLALTCVCQSLMQFGNRCQIVIFSLDEFYLQPCIASLQLQECKLSCWLSHACGINIQKRVTFSVVQKFELFYPCPVINTIDAEDLISIVLYYWLQSHSNMSNDVSLRWIVDMDIRLVMWCNKKSTIFNVWSLLH